MSDNIWGKRFAERNNAGQDDFAWHRLGTRLPAGDLTVRQAVEIADIDYGVVTVPLFFRSPTDGQPIQSDQVAIIRPAWKGEPEHVYGYASNQYTPLQNIEVAQLLEPLAVHWPVETIGVIRQGADMFITLDAGRRKIGGDEMRQFFFVWNSHDGSSALRVRVTPIRVVCQNTCILGDARATIAMDVRHTRQILQEAAFAFDLVAQLRQTEDSTMEALTRLTKIRLTVDQVADVFNRAYPVREPSVQLSFLEANESSLNEQQKVRLSALKANLETERAKMLKRQLAALERYNVFNGEHSGMAGTGWAAYNAITEVETWRQGGTDQQAATSILMGERGATMARAYDAILEYA